MTRRRCRRSRAIDRQRFTRIAGVQIVFIHETQSLIRRDCLPLSLAHVERPTFAPHTANQQDSCPTSREGIADGKLSQPTPFILLSLLFQNLSLSLSLTHSFAARATTQESSSPIDGVMGFCLVHFIDNGNRHDETYSVVRRKRDDDYTLYHHKTHTHTHVDKADKRETQERWRKEKIKRIKRARARALALSLAHAHAHIYDMKKNIGDG